jgi:L-rhamnose mutarotase
MTHPWSARGGVTPVHRALFQLQVKPGHLDAYREAHAAVWHEMLEALRDTGWRNYSIFLRDDGLVLGYFEAEDVAATMAAMSRTAVDPRWQAAMAEHFQDTGELRLIPEVFNLDEQLAAASTPARPTTEASTEPSEREPS